MDGLPLSALYLALTILLLLSGFFSGSETVMMAANRYRLKHAAEQGDRGAQRALDLLAKTDKLLGMILLGNTLFNAGAATVAGVICIRLLGNQEWVLGASTLLVTFAMLVFAEITPKVIGAGHADRLAPILGHLLTPMLRGIYPVVWFVNLFVGTLLALLRLKPHTEAVAMSPEELRILVLEAGHFVPQKHRSILLNLFELEDITVEDVMTPRGTLESLDIQLPMAEIREQLATSYHTRLPVFDGELDKVLGILHQRRLMGAMISGELDKERLQELLVEPYFIPASTPVLAQLQYFQENQQRVALVVDEYGEIVGLVTLEDMVEEIIGKFTTSMPSGVQPLTWSTDARPSVLVDGSRSLRELNSKLRLKLPLEGPKTLNGLILEHFQDIPEAGVSVKIADVPMEVVHTQDRMVKTVRLFRPLH